MNTRLSPTIAAVSLAAFAPCSIAQGLLDRSPQQMPAAPATQPAPASPSGQPAQPASTPGGASPSTGAHASGHVSLESVSLFAVTPPPPRQWAKHDLVEIIINETSTQKLEQTMDTKKSFDLQAELKRFPSLRHLLEAQLREGDSTGLPVGVDAGAGSNFKGEGEFERKDRLTTRIAATVIEVKPNGTLVLEARRFSQTDGETKSMVLSGVCRAEDITKSNTIQSTQLANFVMKIEHEGEVKKAGEKGLIPRVLDAIFNF